MKKYEELSPLLNRINQQHDEICRQVRKLQRKTDELNQVIVNMREGLVLLDKNGVIISINPAAIDLFSTDSECLGKNLCEMDRHYDMTTAA